MKRWGFTTLAFGVLLACCVAQTRVAQSDNLLRSNDKVAGSQSNALQFIPVAPCRVVDTRGLDGTFGGPPIQGGT
jgi:hypothetical protein